MINTTMINRDTNLLGLVSRDTSLRRKANSNGGEWCGPCPWCGGEDRFLVWPNAEPARWWCRQCQRGGDTIAYVMQHHNLGFQQACSWLNSKWGAAVPWQDRSRRPRKVMPTSDPGPPPADWQEAMQHIVVECETLLWSDVGERARAYLREQRGLKDDTLRAFRIGYHYADGDLRGSMMHGNYVHRGIIIPWFAGGHIWKLQIRRPTSSPKERYVQVKGPAGYGPGLFGADKLTGKPNCVVVEGEFDAMLVWQEAGDLVDVLTLGAKDRKITDRWLPLLLPIHRFWIATDNDEGGHQAGAYWLDLTGERGRRIMPPGGAKDIGEAWLARADIRSWVQSALSAGPDPSSQNSSPVPSGSRAG